MSDRLPRVITSCATCPCGEAAAVRSGGRCPLVDRKRPANATLALEGLPIDTVWFIKRGTVILTRTGDDARERTRGIRGPGAFIGLEVLLGRPHAYTARTTEPTVVCGLGPHALETWLGPRGAPARMALEQTLLASIDDCSRAAAPDGTARARVARWILEEPIGERRVPRRVIADLLGIVPETLSRALAQLHRQGLIELTRRTVTARDRAGLASIAG